MRSGHSLSRRTAGRGQRRGEGADKACRLKCWRISPVEKVPGTHDGPLSPKLDGSPTLRAAALPPVGLPRGHGAAVDEHGAGQLLHRDDQPRRVCAAARHGWPAYGEGRIG